MSARQLNVSLRMSSGSSLRNVVNLIGYVVVAALGPQWAAVMSRLGPIIYAEQLRPVSCGDANDVAAMSGSLYMRTATETRPGTSAAMGNSSAASISLSSTAHAAGRSNRVAGSDNQGRNMCKTDIVFIE